MSKAIQLRNAVSMRGASMGRPNDIDPNETGNAIKFRLYRMPMSSCGAYDNGGAYWGCGDHQIGWMYHAVGDGEKFVQQIFIRATTREGAKAQVRGYFPKAKFYR